MSKRTFATVETIWDAAALAILAERQWLDILTINCSGHRVVAYNPGN